MNNIGIDKIIAILQGLLVPVIAVITTYIAYQQHKINKQREKRESKQAKLAIYRKLKNFLSHYNRQETIPKEKYDEIKDAIAEADFLFPEDILAWLDEFERAFEGVYDWQELAKENGGTKAIDLSYKYDDEEGMKDTAKTIGKTVDKLHDYQFGIKDIFAKSMKL